MAKKIITDETDMVMRAETPLELELLIMWREASEWKRQRIRRLFFAIKNGLQLDIKTVSKMTDDEKIAFVEALPKFTFPSSTNCLSSAIFLGGKVN